MVRRFALFLSFILCAASAAWGGSGRLNADGTLDLEANFRYPPTTAQIEAVREQLRRANDTICDATDGQVRFGRIRLTGGGAHEDAANFWIYAEPGRSGLSYYTNGASLGTLGDHITLFNDGIDGEVMAHELGHHAFGIGDEYAERQRWTLGDPCGIGPTFDNPPDGQNETLMSNHEAESEFSVASNHDLQRGTNTVCPPAMASTGLAIDAGLSDTAPILTFDGSSFSNARNTSNANFDAGVFDSLGGVPPHFVAVFFNRTGTRAWRLRFGINDGDISMGTAGNLRILQTVDITLNASNTLATISPAMPTVAINNLANGAANITLTLDLGTINMTDGLRGAAATSVLGWDAGGFARCTDRCAEKWSTVTNNYETSDQTLSHGDSGWQTLRRNYPQITLPAGLPVAAAPMNCRNRINFVDDVVGSDQVMLIIDRSGSMAAPVAAGATSTRLDFAQAAARAFVDLQAGSGAEVGLVSFDDATRMDRQILALAAADAGPFKLVINDLRPGNYTGIGTALAASEAEFQRVTAAGRNRTAFLLSDGQNNRGEDPNTAAQRLRDRGVRIFTIPVGSAADRSLLTNIASRSGGLMFDAPTGSELPAIYAELFARARGESLALPRSESAVRRAPEVIIRHPLANGVALAARRDIRLAQGPLLPEFDEFPIPVEGGGTQLNVFLSARNLEVTDWAPGFTLTAPDGTTVSDASPGVIQDRYYRIVRVPSPGRGIWRLRVFARTNNDQFSYVLAHVENPLPDLYADSVPRVVAPAEPVTISAEATFGAELMGPVSYEGIVRRPDGTSVPITFSRGPGGAMSASFSSYVGRGLYDVTVRTVVDEGAMIRPGESIFPGPPTSPFQPVPFVRVARTAFFVNDSLVPNPPGNDDDGDGIPDPIDGNDDIDGDNMPGRADDDSDGDDVPDAVEGTVDTDGDSIPDFRDTDSDNDQIPDGSDPERTRPAPRPNLKGLWYSFHLGHGFPVGNMNEPYDPAASITVDFEYPFHDRFSFYAMVGHHYFHGTAVPDLSFTNLSLNLRAYAFGGTWPLFVQVGPGIYWDNAGNTDGGLNGGVGILFPVHTNLGIEVGADLHGVDRVSWDWFVDAKLGVRFRF